MPLIALGCTPAPVTSCPASSKPGTGVWMLSAPLSSRAALISNPYIAPSGVRTKRRCDSGVDNSWKRVSPGLKRPHFARFCGQGLRAMGGDAVRTLHQLLHFSFAPRLAKRYHL